MKSRYFIHPKAGGRFWSISIDGATVTVEHGKVGGKLTSAAETFKGKNLGKSNEITPEQDAQNRALVQVEKKQREGYVEYAKRRGAPQMGDYGHNGGYYYKIGEEIKAEINFDRLPESLCFYKPDNTVSGALEKKMLAGKAWYTRKRNGLAYIIAKGPSGKVQIYSRRMHKQHDKELDTDHTWNDRFPHIVADCANMLPCNSIILGEIVVDRDGRDDFTYAQRLVKSTTKDAIQLQIGLVPSPNPDPIASAECKKASFYVWDIAFWNGENLFQYKTAIRFQRIHAELTVSNGEYAGDLRYPSLIPIEWYTNRTFDNPDFAISHAKAKDWEGFVVVDPDGIYGEKGFNFKGKPDRPRNACGKLKPTFYDDFVIEFDPDDGVGEWSTKDKYADGERRGIKNVVMFQYDSKGNKHYISELGVGLTEEMKRELADPKLFPQVWEVSYKDRRYVAQGDDTNALDFSSFERVRWTKKDGGDKTPEECVNDSL